MARTRLSRVITDIILPYVIFEALWTLTKWLVEGETTPNPTQPSWTLWFLLALGIFRLVLPYLALLRWPLLWVLLGIGGVACLYAYRQVPGEATEPESRWSRPMTIGAFSSPLATMSLKA